MLCFLTHKWFLILFLVTVYMYSVNIHFTSADNMTILLILTCIFQITSMGLASNLIYETVFATGKYYNHNFKTSVVWGPTSSDIVGYFLEDFPGVVVTIPLPVNNYSAIESFCTPDGYQQTVLFTNNIEEFVSFMSVISQKLKYTIRLILVLTKTENENKNLSIFFEEAWNNDLVDFVILKEDDSNNIKAVTYFPYDKGICGNFEPVVLESGDNLFPRKLNNFHRCLIKITFIRLLNLFMFDIKNGTISSLSGLESHIFMLVMEKLNVTVKTINAVHHGDFGTIKNGKPSGYFKDLMDRKSDIIFPAGILIQARYSVSQISKGFRILDVRWCGPKPQLISPWLKMLLPFINSITLLLGIATASFVIVTVIIKSIKLKRNFSTHSVLFQSYIILLGQSVEFVTTWPILNSLFMMWIWFCFIVRMYYQGIIVDNMQTNIFEPPFSSLEDAIDRVDGFGGGDVFRDQFVNSYKVVPMTEFDEIIDRIAKGERFLLVADMLVYNNIKPSSVQFFKANIGLVQTCLYMRPGWAAAKEVNFILSRLVDGGFIHHFLGKRKAGFREEDESVQLVALNISMLGVFIYGLAAMWVVCFIIFILEIICYKYVANKS